MRPIYCLIFLLLVTLLRADAQTGLDSFYKQGSTWKIYDYLRNPFPSPGQTTVWAFDETIEGDSIINGTSYHLVSQRVHDGFYKGSNGVILYYDTLGPKYLIRGIRTDGQKVYSIDISNGATAGPEKLIYNFALNVGDTMLPTHPNNINSIVVSIDTVQLSNGAKLRKYNFFYYSNLVEMYWIEGIGSRIDFAVPESNAFPPSLHHSLCYKSADGYEYTFPDSTLVGNLNDNCFAIPVSVEDVAPMGEEVTIFPNPVVDQFVTVQSAKGILSLRLYDVTGKLCTEREHIKSNEAKLFVPESSGLYILDMELAGGRHVKRKIYR